MDISSTLMSAMLFKPILWILFIGGLLLLGFGSLWLRKQRKLEYPTLVFSQVGAGKASIILTKAGWFKEKSIFGLFDYGRESKLKLKDGRVIWGMTRENMHFFKGKRAIVCFEKGDDRKVVVPIDQCTLTNDSKDMLLEIAPVDLRDVSSQINESNNQELKSNMMQYLQMALMGIMAVVLIIGIILVVQMVNNGQAEAKDLILQSMKYSCAELKTTVQSFAP